MSSTQIKALQQRLAESGCYLGPVDGTVGPGLLEAIKACPSIASVSDVARRLAPSIVQDQNLTLTSNASQPKFWSGPPPNEVHFDALSAGLAAQAIAREIDRIATMEASPAAADNGELTVERLPLGGILALALGPPPPLRPPSAAVKLRVGTLDLTDALTAHEFVTTLRFDKGRLDLDDFTMRIAGGGASGHVTLRRDADNVTLTGALTLDSVALNRPGFSGRIGATLDYASTGRSPALLINGLAGSGTMTFAGAALARSDPAALDRVVAKSQVPDAPLDETNIAFAFANELNRAPLEIPDGSTPLSLSAGVIKIGPIKIPQGKVDETLSGDFDLRTLATQARFTLTSSAEGLKFWSGPPPSAAVTVDNALEGPMRQVDISLLSAALAAQAIARESDRISEMVAEISEGAFFKRRLKGERFMDRRQQEIQDWQIEQARLKGQAEHLRNLEEAEKAAEAEAAAEKAGKPPGYIVSDGKLDLRPTLYGLFVGVRDYQDPKYDTLQFPDRDAEDFAKALQAQKGLRDGLYADVQTKVVDLPNRENVIDGLYWLKRQATSNDITVVFLSGHGITDPRKDFWFLTRDADLTRLRASAISSDDLKDILTSIPGKTILFIDACHAGAALLAGLKEMPEDVNPDMKKLVKDFSTAGSGLVVYGSSMGSELSQENAKWKHGAFAEALIEAIDGKAAGASREITIDQLGHYVAERVKELTGGNQHPIMNRSLIDFPFAVAHP